MARVDFYESYVGTVQALSADRLKGHLDTIKRGKVFLMKQDCYAIKSDTINEIIGKTSPQNSNHFATLYKGWPLDSNANPLRVKALFKLIHGSISNSGNSGGAIIPCSVIDAHGLEVQVDKASFERADAPKKYGRQEEQAEFPVTPKQAGGSRTPRAQSLKPDGSQGTKRRRDSTSVAQPEGSAEGAGVSGAKSDEDMSEEADVEVDDESDEEDGALTLQELDHLYHRIRTQMFGDDVRKINVEDHENLLEAYDKLRDKYARAKQQVDELKSTLETRTAQLEAWSEYKKAVHAMPTPNTS